jgi:type II restriction enzyme
VISSLTPLSFRESLLKFINSSDDLITSHGSTVEGFLKQALTKTGKATLYSEAASRLHEVLQRVRDIETLDVILDDQRYRPGLIAAAGFSTKAKNHLTKEELDNAIKKVFSTLKDQLGEAFREEIVYRYLLTFGDTLGGSMRNWVGAQASLKLTDALIAALPPVERVEITKSATGKVQRIEWDYRILRFDVKTKLIGTSVDVILLDASQAASQTELITIPRAYLACGELKGGIDPAGSDEHWKTARTALNRIQVQFDQYGHKPARFFVGAAIVLRVAEEIYSDLQSGVLTHAANLTVDEQVEDLAQWLVAL